jgi:transcriptional regulator with XRE-family HTH domain
MNVSQSQFARLVGVDPRTIWNWEARVYAPTLSKRFRLGQLMRLVEEIDKNDRLRALEFANEPGRYNRPGRPQPRIPVVYQIGY